MRVVLFTGKGGVGKTTVAAATASLAAASGRKTLVVSTDAAHSVADVFGTELTGRPTEVDAGLFGMQVDHQAAFERSWRGIQDYLFALLSAAGVGEIDAAELLVVPGAEEILALLAVRDAARSGDFDVVCVDCAPTAETLRLLRLPEALGWWLRKLQPEGARLLRTMRPWAARTAGVPLPGVVALDAANRLRDDLADVRSLLADESCGIRLVLTPERVVLAEARRTATALALHGYRLEGVVANRILPAGSADDDWQARWVEQQAAVLAQLDADFADVPRWRFPYAAAEPIGVAALSELAQGSYGDLDPVADGGRLPAPMEVEPTDDGFTLSLPLPFVASGEVELARSGDDLLITVAGTRRAVTLPSALRRCVVQGARLTEGCLVVRFVPNPDLWFRS